MLKALGGFAQTGGGGVGAVTYKGTWNANTNTPTLVSSTGTQGDYYVVNVAGTTNLDGITDWEIGDWAIFNGVVWQKVDNTESVISVNGQTGVVVLTAANVNAVADTAIITAGTGLSGGGTLASNTTISLANTAVTLASVTVPGWSMGVGGGMEIDALFTVTNNATVKTLGMTFGGGTLLSAAAANNASACVQKTICNRGGSQIIRMNEKYRFALNHETYLFKSEQGRKDGTYRHRFVIWDNDWNLVKVSKQFSFLNAEVEFAVGMCKYENDYLMTFGFQDNAAYLLKFPEKISKALFVIGNDMLLEKDFSDITKSLVEKKEKLQKEYEILIRQEAELTDNLNKLYFYMNNIGKKSEKVE